MICEAASKYNIPLEVNLGSISAIEAGIKNMPEKENEEYNKNLPMEIQKNIFQRLLSFIKKSIRH